jgi:hypothetical protein
MKYLLPLISLGIYLAACQSNPTTPAAADVATPVAPLPPTVAPANSEHIEWSEITINGKPNTQLTTQLLKKQLGRPDSIAKGAVECGSGLDIPVGSPDGDFWYYGKTMYEVNGSQAIVVNFNVGSGKFQGKLRELILNQNTTLEDVRHFFPQAAKGADVPATGRPGEVMSLPFFYKGTEMDASLNLIFKKGHLQEVEFWYPC